MDVQALVRSPVGADPFKGETMVVLFKRGIHEEQDIVRLYTKSGLGQELVSEPEAGPLSRFLQVPGQKRGKVVTYTVILPEGVAVPEDTERCSPVRQFFTSPFRFPSAPNISRCRGILPTAWVEQERQGS